MLQILVVEDEQSISNLIKINLTRAGYACDCAYDGLAAVDMLDKKPYDLVLLDIMLPGADGYEIMDYIAPLEIPVIFLTAKASVADRVKGLRMGADDYLTKPFEIIELLARVESVLRRYHKTEQVLTEGDLVVDTASRTVTKKGETISLTKRNLTCSCSSYAIKISPFTGRPSTSASGAANTWATAGRWICMCSGCGKKRAWRSRFRPCTE